MRTTSRLSRAMAAIGIVAISLALSGCAELLNLVEIVAYEESDDPKLQSLGKRLQSLDDSAEADRSLDRFAETRDPRDLDAARELDPDNNRVLAYDLAFAHHSGDPEQIRAAERALAVSSAKRLDYKVGAITADQVRAESLQSLLIAQMTLYGGSVWRVTERPPPDASPETIQQFEDLCATHNALVPLGTEYTGVTMSCE